MKYDVSCGGFVDVLYQFEGVPFYFTFVECFHNEGMLNFYQVHFLSALLYLDPLKLNLFCVHHCQFLDILFFLVLFFFQESLHAVAVFPCYLISQWKSQLIFWLSTNSRCPIVIR